MSGTKTGNRYFSHDSDAFLDSRIIKMRAKLGLAGYGAYWMIIERLRTADGYRHECDYEVFACLANSDAELFKSVIENFDLFEFEENDGQTYFYSASLKRRMKHMDNIIEKRREAGRLGGEAKARKQQESKEKEQAELDDEEPIDDQMPEQMSSKGVANAKQVPYDCHSKGVANSAKLNQTKLKQSNSLSPEIKSITEDPSSLVCSSQPAKAHVKSMAEIRKKWFEEYYDNYPRRQNKGQAEKAWENMKPPVDEELFKVIMDKVNYLKTTEDWTKNNGKYIPLASTWLSAKGWLDEIPQTRGNGQTKVPDRNRIRADHEYDEPTAGTLNPHFQEYRKRQEAERQAAKEAKA